jgi:hypothetical protein
LRTVNRLMVEVYKNKNKIQADIQNGWASITQKKNIVKLEVLSDAVLFFGSDSIEVEKGCKVLVKEAILHTQCKEINELDGKEFMLLEMGMIIGFCE